MKTPRRSVHAFKTAALAILIPLLAGCAETQSTVGTLSVDTRNDYRQIENSLFVLRVYRAPFSYRLYARSDGALLVEQTAIRIRRRGGPSVPFLPDELGPVAAGKSGSGKSGAAGAGELVARGTIESSRGDATIPAVVTFGFAEPDALRVGISTGESTGNPPKSTIDPDTVAPAPETPDASTADDAIEVSFAAQSERYYGGWEYSGERGVLDDNGRREAISGGHLFMHGGDWMSVRAPFFMSSRGYGVWIDTLEAGRLSFDRRGETTFSFSGDRMTYFVFYGRSTDRAGGGGGAATVVSLPDLPGSGHVEETTDYSRVLEAYTRPEFGGRPVLPPDWALTSMWWRDDFHAGTNELPPAVLAAISSRGLKPDMGDVILDDLSNFTRLRIPIGALLLDRPYLVRGPRDAELPGYGTLVDGKFVFDFRDPHEVLSRVSHSGVHILSWAANRLAADTLDIAQARHITYTPRSRAVDIRLTAGQQFWQQMLSPLVADYPVSGFSVDRGDENGVLQMLGPLPGPVYTVPGYLANFNAVRFPELVAKIAAAARGADHYVYARSAFDRARTEVGVWGADARGWAGLQESVRDMLRSGLIGFPVWGSDVGGYPHPLVGDITTPELWIRWLEFAAFSPHMELLLGPSRTPWHDFPPELVRIFSQYVRLKHYLLPYYRTLAYQAHTTGMPAARPRFVEQLSAGPTTGTRGGAAWSSYYFGDDLLVAPVMTAGRRQQRVPLPQGNWMRFPLPEYVVDGFSDASTVDSPTASSAPAGSPASSVGPSSSRPVVYAGGRTVTVDAPIGSIPVFVRSGAIIPMGDILKANDTWEPEWRPSLDILLFPSTSREGSLSYYREKRFPGEVSDPLSQITLDADADGVSIEFDPLGTPGFFEVYSSKPTAVTLNGHAVAYRYDADSERVTVDFKAMDFGEIDLAGARPLQPNR